MNKAEGKQLRNMFNINPGPPHVHTNVPTLFEHAYIPHTQRKM